MVAWEKLAPGHQSLSWTACSISLLSTPNPVMPHEEPHAHGPTHQSLHVQTSLKPQQMVMPRSHLGVKGVYPSNTGCLGE